MNHPSSHSFSRSPVKEVLCCCFTSPGFEALSRTIQAPYPGWLHIRDEVREMISVADDVSGITGCMIRYSDLIPAEDCRNLSGPIDVINRLTGKIRSHSSGDRGENVIISTEIQNTTGSVSSIHDDPGNPGWTLIFTIRTDSPVCFSTDEAVLTWFDDARGEIHRLFDLVVPVEIVQTLR